MFRRLLIAGLVLLPLVSCSKMETGTLVPSTFRAVIEPEIEVKSGEEATVSVNHAVLEAWRGETRVVRQEITLASGTETVVFSDVRLTAGLEYDIYIWADNGGAYDTSDLRTVNLASGYAYDGTVDGRDAFCSCSTLYVRQNQAAGDVTLKRPFARVDLILPEGTASVGVKVSAPTAFDLKAGTVSGVQDFFYDFNCTEKGTTTVSDFVFAGSETMNLDYAFTVGGDSEHSLTVPVKRNCKTNVQVGDSVTN